MCSPERSTLAVPSSIAKKWFENPPSLTTTCPSANSSLSANGAILRSLSSGTSANSGIVFSRLTSTAPSDRSSRWNLTDAYRPCRRYLTRLGLDVEAELHLVVDVVGVEQLVVEELDGAAVHEHPLGLQHLVALLGTRDHGEPQVGAGVAGGVGALLTGDAQARSLGNPLGFHDSLDRRRRVLADHK